MASESMPPLPLPGALGDSCACSAGSVHGALLLDLPVGLLAHGERSWRVREQDQMGDDEHHLPPHSVQALRDAAKYLAKAAKLLRKVIVVEASPTADEPTIVTAPTRPAVVISLFDYTCLSLAPWQARGLHELYAKKFT